MVSRVFLVSMKVYHLCELAGSDVSVTVTYLQERFIKLSITKSISLFITHKDRKAEH